jgi:pyruvate,water dikinase
MNRILKGVSASKGKIEGKVCVIEKSSDLNRFEAGCILVTRITDPSFVFAMSQSIGVVTDIGGLTSHPAIISREMGIPCVVGTESATKRLKTGDKIILDADKGEIYEK